MRDTIHVRGARENNLTGIDIEIPRERLVVVTGMSGSGKSSLAFDTIYAEGQRRLLASMSSFAKRFVSQLRKPDVDFVDGLSPVISIDQKTVASSPRSTVGTMTDISDYLRMLFATTGQPYCPICEEAVPVLTPHQMMERMLSLPAGTEVEVRAPVSKIYGEDYEYLFEQIRVNGYRHARVDGKYVDLGDENEIDEDEDYAIEAVVDRFVVEDGIDKQVVASLTHGLKVGDGFLSFHPGDDIKPRTLKKFYRDFGCKKHRVLSGPLHHGNFTFNDPSGACVTCSGIGTSMRVHPDLLVPDKSRSLWDGAIVRNAFTHDKNSWGGRILNSLSKHYDFSLDTPFEELSDDIVDILFHGTRGEKIEIVLPEGAKQGKQHAGKLIRFSGVIRQIEYRYRWYRKQGNSSEGMENYLRKVMVEFDCPECGGARLKRARRLVRVDGRTIHELGELHLGELLTFFEKLKPPEPYVEAGRAIIREVTSRLSLLIEIGLDYLSLNRRSGTLSGGESQRIRLSSQIGSGLMGMLYVLDEPSIGLHAKDNTKMIRTLERLRDIGNTVIVVEHDEETIRAADHIVEIGPGPGIHGGRVVAEGSIASVLKNPKSLTGKYLSGEKSIGLPSERRETEDRFLRVRGARHNNLRDVDVDIPLGVLTCITGASGSGKSSLIHEIVYKKLYSALHDSRVLSGDHDELLGVEHIDDVINVDQSPIGRSPRSNPATYIGFYDNIRKLFAETDGAKARGYTASRFSFNVKGGRCEACGGEGTIVTKLSFMPDVEVICPSCRGARYNQETLDVTYKNKNIADVLETSIEEGVEFFADESLIARKLAVLNDLGLGYLKIGHPATILSGGEAQRIKLASELGKIKRSKHSLYIFDEPTTGLHFADIERLLDCLNRLVEAGNSVIVIEHNMDVIKTADHIIDLGPDGGHRGGRVLATGTPEEVTQAKESPTGRYLRDALKSNLAPSRNGAAKKKKAAKKSKAAKKTKRRAKKR
ncbi:MAG: excinuclease ABC subunit UvrA [Planctomycetota bacterium]